MDDELLGKFDINHFDFKLGVESSEAGKEAIGQEVGLRGRKNDVKKGLFETEDCYPYYEDRDQSFDQAMA